MTCINRLYCRPNTRKEQLLNALALDPSDLAVTARALAVMLADGY
ncbi:hypothetical protein [Marivita geojedonensis]|nr:hypothetical protein [Marivita geojedonensis]